MSPEREGQKEPAKDTVNEVIRIFIREKLLLQSPPGMEPSSPRYSFDSEDEREPEDEVRILFMIEYNVELRCVRGPWSLPLDLNQMRYDCLNHILFCTSRTLSQHPLRPIPPAVYPLESVP